MSNNEEELITRGPNFKVGNGKYQIVLFNSKTNKNYCLFATEEKDKINHVLQLSLLKDDKCKTPNFNYCEDSVSLQEMDNFEITHGQKAKDFTEYLLQIAYQYVILVNNLETNSDLKKLAIKLGEDINDKAHIKKSGHDLAELSTNLSGVLSGNKMNDCYVWLITCVSENDK